MLTQKKKVLNHMLKYGSITSMKAYRLYKITCLAERIRDLKDSGYSVKSEMKTSRQGKRHAEYSLE